MPPSDPRPLVGVSMYRQTTSWWAWERDAALVPGCYLDMVERAGAQPVLLPPSGDRSPRPSSGRAPRLVDALDALVLVGGGDVDPARYGHQPGPRNGGTSRSRDEQELELLAEAVRRDLPVLAVCRGMQLLNVQRGGSLLQHLPDVVGTDAHQPGAGAFAEVVVTAEAGSTVGAVLGHRFEVLCSHHQAVDAVGEGLRVTARSDDGVVEALEVPGCRFVVGVQWHPEESGDVRLFEALVAATRSDSDRVDQPSKEHR